MTESINQFINDQSCATICCISEQGTPYCFNCFYAYDEKNALLYFKSSPSSNHAEMLKNSKAELHLTYNSLIRLTFWGGIVSDL